MAYAPAKNTGPGLWASTVMIIAADSMIAYRLQVLTSRTTLLLVASTATGICTLTRITLTAIAAPRIPVAAQSVGSSHIGCRAPSDLSSRRMSCLSVLYGPSCSRARLAISGRLPEAHPAHIRAESPRRGGDTSLVIVALPLAALPLAVAVVATARHERYRLAPAAAHHRVDRSFA